MTIVTDTNISPPAWAVEKIRNGEAARLDGWETAENAWRHSLHGWSRPDPYIAMTEDEIMAAATDHAARVAEYGASPRGRIRDAIRELREVGSHEVASSIENALDRSKVLGSLAINPATCGHILKVLDGMNTSTARAIVQAVGENLRAL